MGLPSRSTQWREDDALDFAKVEVDYVARKAIGSEGDKPTLTHSIAENVSE